MESFRLWPRTRFLFGVFAAIALAHPVQAHNTWWSTIGAAGIVDEASVGKVLMHDTGSATLRSGFIGTAQIRYPIPYKIDMTGENPDGGERPLWNVHMLVRDTGRNARVVVTLLRVDEHSGEVTTIATWNSNTDQGFGLEGSPNYRDAWIDNGRLEIDFAPERSAYFIDVKLTRTASTGDPGIRLIKIGGY